MDQSVLLWSVLSNKGNSLPVTLANLVTFGPQILKFAGVAYKGEMLPLIEKPPTTWISILNNILKKSSYYPEGNIFDEA